MNVRNMTDKATAGKATPVSYIHQLHKGASATTRTLNKEQDHPLWDLLFLLTCILTQVWALECHT